ncbi:MAG: O-antigen ligase family protein [Coriobacteriia bacterium]
MAKSAKKHGKGSAARSGSQSGKSAKGSGKSGGRQGKVARQTTGRPVITATTPDVMSTSQRIAWIALHCLVFITPLIISNWTWLGFRLPFTYDQFDIIKVYSQRIFTLIALGAWSWHLFTSGGRLRRTKIDYFVLALLGWVLLTTFTSIHPPTAFFGKYRRFEGFLAFLNYATIFFLVTQFADRASRIKSFANTLFYSGTLVSFYGLLQYLGMDPIQWGNLPFEANRAFSTYGNPDLLGGFLVFPLAISLALALAEDDLKMRVVYWSGFLITMSCWIVAFTRGAWVGGAVALIVLAVIAFRHSVKFNAVDWSFIASIGAVATALVVISLNASSAVMNVWLRIKSIFDVNDGSARTRFEIWQAAWDATKARPIVGHGADTFRLVFPRYKPPEYVADAGYLSVADNVHNYPLQVSSALGIPGFLLLYGTFVAAAWFSAPLIFAKREGPDRLVLGGFWAACAGYLASLMFGLSVTGSTFLLWVCMALVLAPLARAVEIKRPGTWGVIAAAVSLVVCAALIAGSTVYITADNHYLQARIFATGDMRIAEAKRAIELNPYNDMYRAELALAYVDNSVQAVTTLAQSNGADANARAIAEQQFVLAETQLKDVIEFVPWEYDNYVFLANLYNLGAEYLDPGYVDDAVEWARKGVAVERYGPAVRFQLARALLKQGNIAEAKEHIAYAAELDPNYADAWVLLGDIARAEGDSEAAVDAYRRAFALMPTRTDLQSRIESLSPAASAEETITP